VKTRICSITLILVFSLMAKASPAFCQDQAGCEQALKDLTKKAKAKKENTLPYVCPKQLGAQLQTVLANIKDSTPNGYQFEKAVLHIETGSTTEVDVGLNLVVFSITYKGKKGLTQSLDTQFTRQDKQQLKEYLEQLQSFSLLATEPDAKTKQKTAEEKLKDALNEAMTIASEVTILPNVSVVAKVQFSVSNELDAGVSFIIYGSSKASAGIDFAKTSVNSIEITLKKMKS
jgi:hypothetical protein